MAGKVKVARRYARALANSIEFNSLDSIAAALDKLSEIYGESTELRTALLNPANAKKERVQAVRAIASKISGGNAPFENLCGLLVENGRLDILPEIAREFRSMVERMKKLSTVEVTSAADLSSGEQDEIRKKAESALGGTASIKWHTDPELIGGLVLRIGDRMLDRSVRGVLESLRAELVS